MENVFFYNRSYSKYLKNYLKVYFILIVFYLLLIIKFKFEDHKYSIVLFWGFIIGIPILLFISSIIQYLRSKDIKYIFADKSIIINKKGKEKIYLHSDIVDICRPRIEKLKKTGIDYIKFKFRNDEKIIFMNTLPFFSRIDTFLVQYLKDKLDYNIRRV